MTAPAGEAERVDVVVVTGMSGSGRSTAIHVLEDLGYYCIDNLPSALVEQFVTTAPSGFPCRLSSASTCSAQIAGVYSSPM